MKYYLAYGSNLNIEQMRYRCPDAQVVGKAYLEDYQLLFKGSKTGSYLTVESCKGSKVPLGIWLISDADERKLDRYEGYPTFYYKKTIKFRFNGRIEEGIIYIMHENRKLGIPSVQYVDTCLVGYKNFGFNLKYLDKAYKISSEVEDGNKE